MVGSNINNSSASGGIHNQEDLDTFLTTIESRLRGPFSSLELANAVRTNAARGIMSPAQYLQNLAQVLSRTDKAIQSRMLIGLLGLDPSEETTPEILTILKQAQEAPEEWVRATAGLIQGIMFQTPAALAAQKESDSGTGTHVSEHMRSCRGEEATKLLDKLCDEVCTKVEETISQAIKEENQVPPDLNASFAPFRYSLLSPNLLKPIFPECCGSNPHFQVNEKAAILHVDETLEAQRAKEEQEHQAPISMNPAAGTNGSSTSSTAAAATAAASNLPPGFRPIKLVNSKNSTTKAATSSSMFMPKKPNATLMQRQKLMQQQQLLKKTPLRRKGAAQSLVNNISMKEKIAAAKADAANGAATNPTARPSGFSSGKFGSGGRAMAASRMKRIDLGEVQALNDEHAARDEADANARHSKKRRILDAAMQRGLKKTKGDAPSSGLPNSVPAAASAAAVTPNSPAAQPSMSNSTSAADSAAPQADSQGDNNGDWRELLKDRSNKLSSDDWLRIQQFYEQKINPDPSETVVKMKLHEQRSTDASSGQPIKETFYLELDYRDFSSKQSRKVKRY